MKISIVIPNYNGEKILKENLPKVLDSTHDYNQESEIIISDDASIDNSVSVINDFFEKNKISKTKFKLITSQKNKGFSSNVNKGVSESSGEIIVLLNTDVVPRKNFLEPLLKHFEDEELFAVGCMDESVEDGKVILRGRGKGKWERGFLVHSAAALDGSETLWVSGGSGAFRKSIWDKLGGLDPNFNPFYWEDIDLSYRARKSGYKTLFEKNSVVHHDHEKGIIKSKFKPTNVKKIVYRNQFTFAWKNSDFSTLISHLFWLPYHLIRALFSSDFPLIAGFIFALKNLPEIVKARNRARKLFIKSDKEVTSIA